MKILVVPMGASFHCILLMRTSWHQAKSFIKGDVRPLIKFLRKIHYWIVVTYLINGWISSYCVWLICISYEDPLLDCISYEDPPLDRIPDGDPLLAHAWVRGQRSDLDRSDLLKNWRPHTEIQNARRPMRAISRKAPHWEVPFERIENSSVPRNSSGPRTDGAK